jgi:RNA polymerase sigma-70 factor, ECF subfamily
MVPSPQPDRSRARLVALPSPTLAQADDATLARAASSGDPRATSVLWDRFSPLVRRMLRRTLGPDAEVDGLLQEVFLRVVRQLGGLPESTQLKPFVVAVTARLLNAELKRHRVRRLLRLSNPWRVEAEPSASSTAQTALSALYKILDGLDADARLAFTLRYFEGLQITELATATDASLSSAKRRLARATARVEAAVSRDAAFGAYATAATLGEAP